MGGVQALNSPGCTLNSTYTVNEAISAITVSGDTIQADLVGIALNGTRSGSSLTGTLTPGGDPGTGAFTLTKQ